MSTEGAGGPRATRGRTRTPAFTCVALVAILLTALLGAVAHASTWGPSGSALALPLAETAPKVSTQPKSQTIEEGQSVTFSTAASGTAPLSAQWEFSTDSGVTWSPDGAPLESNAAAQLTIAAVKGSENGYQFRVTYSNKAGSATSKPATLTVRALPVVTLQPASTAVEEGHDASFDAAASGLPAPTVQWQTSTNGGSSWSNVSGATATTLTVKAVTTANNGQKYRAVFKNTVGTATSEAATLTVQTKPVVKTNPFDAVVNEGKEAKFLAIGSGSPTPVEQWESSGDGGATWTPIAGANSEFLSLPAVTLSMSDSKYRATFTNAAGSATSKAATLTVDAPAKITQQPTNTTVFAGEEASFEATATGVPAPTVQWELSTNGGISFSAIADATQNKLVIAETKAGESGRKYRAAFKNTAGTTFTEAATLTVATTRYGAVGWGADMNGQLGNGGTENSAVPSPVSGLKFVASVAGGGRHSLALMLDGTVRAWGFNGFGQLGVEGIGSTTKPVTVEHLSGVTQIAAGGNHSLALLANGTVMAWGDNESGQLGNGGSEESEVPVPVEGLTGVKQIAAGDEFSLALLSDGTVMAWGNDESGQLGNGVTKNTDHPVAVKGLTGTVTQIAAGGEFALALLEGGTVEGWGADEAMQLTVEESEAGFIPSAVPIAGLSEVKAIAAGRNHGLVLLNDGTVKAWGDDSFGELGNGGTEDSAVPVAVSGLGEVAAIAAGTHDSVALLRSGSLMTWGANKFGALGDGEFGSFSSTPVAVIGVSHAVSVAAGANHMLAVGESIPSVSEVSPKVGGTQGGTVVKITGAQFTGATAVNFGKTPATSFAVESASTITATAPAGSGTVDVTVTTPNGTSPFGPADKFTYAALPTITKLSAKSGPAAGGTTLTITGTQLSGATSVSFGGVETTQLEVKSPTTISVVTPASIAGTVLVTVTTPGGTSATTSKAKFKYLPSVTGLSPASGTIAGGETITITGTGFAPGTTETTFKFGSKKATGINCTSTTTCTVTTPAQTGTVDVIATARKAKSAPNPPADQFTFN